MVPRRIAFLLLGTSAWLGGCAAVEEPVVLTAPALATAPPGMAVVGSSPPGYPAEVGGPAAPYEPGIAYGPPVLPPSALLYGPPAPVFVPAPMLIGSSAYSYYSRPIVVPPIVTRPIVRPHVHPPSATYVPRGRTGSYHRGRR